MKNFILVIILFISLFSCKRSLGKSENKEKNVEKSIDAKWGLIWEDNFSKDDFLDKTKWNVIRAKLESATGAWPAMWMLADNPKYGKYPRNGEIDLMEHLNHEDQFYQTVHSYFTLELKEKTNPQYFKTSRVNCEKFNIYGMEWYSDKLVFTLNGVETFVYPKLKNVDSSQWPFDQPFYIMIDQQLGGSWVGEVLASELPVQMIVDWIKVYKQV